MRACGAVARPVETSHSIMGPPFSGAVLVGYATNCERGVSTIAI